LKGEANDVDGVHAYEPKMLLSLTVTL
ncbi:unnamed protein product, partial [Rotaria magnacalcarata]